MDAPTITLGKHPTTLAKPSTFTALAMARGPDAFDSMQQAEIFALQAMSLAVCWPENKTWPGKFRPRKWRASMKVDEYGAAIFDDLISAGHGVGAILEAGIEAYKFCMMSLPRKQEVAEAEGFSEAPVGG
ncbi:hypothetical protein CMI37_16055 [Candidatus Pacearchaeota archaeon]|nr:hypothetical protein [Candidatus Pacearchaeota archaeon]